MRSRIATIAAAATATITIAVAPAALASPSSNARPTAVPHATFSNKGDVSPSVAMAVSFAGIPEVAAVGKGASLWYYFEQSGKWHSQELGKAGSAYSSPALAAGPRGTADVAVEGARHSLQYYSLSSRHWHHTMIAGKNSTYSAPSIAIGAHGPGIAVQGSKNRLWYYSLSGRRWHASEVFGVNAAYSAPSLVIRNANQVDFGDPAGQADIAVQNANHSLSYYFLRVHGGWRSAQILGSVHQVYSAPSLVVLTGKTDGRDEGSVEIAFEGPGHSLKEFGNISGWVLTALLGPGSVDSAPSIAQGDANRETEIAFQAPDRTLQLYLPDSLTTVAIVQANFTVSSAPVLVNRGSHPAGEADIIIQTTTNSLWYYHAPQPASPTGAPNFTGIRVAGPGSTFGG